MLTTWVIGQEVDCSCELHHEHFLLIKLSVAVFVLANSLGVTVKWRPGHRCFCPQQFLETGLAVC